MRLRWLSLFVIVALVASGGSSVAARSHRVATATPAPLTYSHHGCFPWGFVALITGAGTWNQPIDWSPNVNFVPLGNTQGNNFLEGDSGALAFNNATYPKGVYVRWTNGPTVVTYVPPCLSRVVVVWMENHEASAITATSMPYLYGLSTTYGRATVTAVTHPSLPNYLALWSGSTQGVTDDNTHDFAAPSLASQVTTAGKQWRVYAQDVPGNCYTGATFAGGVDGPGVAGTYARKHEPAISFTSVSGSPSECAKIQPLASFNPTAAEVAFVAPNLCNDMHDCSLAQGDAFLRAFLPSVLNSPDWAHTLLIVSFDEGTTNSGGGGSVFTMVARQGLAGFRSATTHTHYGVLRTIEDVFGLPCLGGACSAAPLTEFLP